MLRLLEDTTFSTAIYHVSGIIQNVRITFETSDTRLLCDIKTEGNNDVRQNT